MIETEVVSRIVDDVTGKEIKTGGWALIHIADGSQWHVQNISDLIRLILNEDAEPASNGTAKLVRKQLENSGHIPAPVLSKAEDCENRQPCTWETCICD